jgi:hypothetical protein
MLSLGFLLAIFVRNCVWQRMWVFKSKEEKMKESMMEETPEEE